MAGIPSSSRNPAADPGSATGSYLTTLGHRQVYFPGTLQSSTFDTGKDYFAPWFLPAPLTVAKFAWTVSTGQGVALSTYRLALYLASAATQPASLIWQSSVQDGSVETLQTDVGPFTLAAGLYLSAVAVDATADALLGLQVLHPGTAVGLTNLGYVSTALQTTQAAVGQMTRVRAFGAFPNPGTSWTTNAGLEGVPLFAQLA